jgi:aspartate kinase
MEPVQTRKTSIKVLKFGGTCLYPSDRRKHVVARIMKEVDRGYPVVAVVSAMGRSGDPYATDTLDELLPGATPSRDRERDALLCCGEDIASSLLAAELSAAGCAAVSIRGGQLGVITDNRFGNAEILSVAPGLMLRYLHRGYVVVAAGFQGIREDGSLTTLGRGGSDTSAVALAAALGAGRVYFFKDVEGIFNGDPKIVPSASPLPMIPYEEAAHLAFAGARILHPRSADLARKEKVDIEISSLKGDQPGTLVTSREKIKQLRPSDQGLFAVTCVEGIGHLKIWPGADRRHSDFPMRVFQELAALGISLDMINLLEDCALFTVPSRDLNRAVDTARHTGCEVRIKEDCAKVSLLGGGIHGVPGIMSRIITALAGIQIPIFQSVDTYTVISVLVDGRHGSEAARALHEAFGLGGQRI